MVQKSVPEIFSLVRLLLRERQNLQQKRDFFVQSLVRRQEKSEIHLLEFLMENLVS